jgi:hypothetical protein
LICEGILFDGLKPDSDRDNLLPYFQDAIPVFLAILAFEGLGKKKTPTIGS